MAPPCSHSAPAQQRSATAAHGTGKPECAQLSPDLLTSGSTLEFLAIENPDKPEKDCTADAKLRAASVLWRRWVTEAALECLDTGDK